MIKDVYKPSKREGGKRVFDRLYRDRFRLDGDEKSRRAVAPHLERVRRFLDPK